VKTKEKLALAKPGTKQNRLRPFDQIDTPPMANVYQSGWNILLLRWSTFCSGKWPNFWCMFALGSGSLVRPCELPACSAVP